MFLIGWLGFISNVWADEEERTTHVWIIQANQDFSFPLDNLANRVNPSWSVQGSVGYRFPINLELSIESGYDSYAARDSSFNRIWTVFPLVFKVQYGFGNGIIQPYVFIGAGAAFNNKTASADGSTIGASETDFLDEGGIGMDFSLDKNSSFFFQFKLVMDHTSSSYSDDTPVFVSLPNAGFKFALN